MKALDTNVLVRFLVNDDTQQAEVVYKAFRKAEAEKNVFFIPLLVILETICVLESVYEVTRQMIVESLNDLLLLPILKFESRPVIHDVIISALETRLELSDLLIAHSAKYSGCEQVITFDKKASKVGFFELLT